MPRARIVDGFMETIGAALLPEGLSWVNASVVVVVSFLSSMLTAALGIGGGLLLLAAMSAMFPPLAVIPVHGVAQLASNFSRFSFIHRHTVWPIVGWFTLGGALGAALGASVYVSLPAWLLRMGVAAFILIMVWAPKPRSFSANKTSFVSVGGAGAFLSIFFGATGPLVGSVLATTDLDRMKVVSTHAVTMVGQHGLKTVAFGIVGFAFAEWAFVILAIIASTTAGAWVGTRILLKLPEKQFQFGFKIVLSVIASYLFILGVLEAIRR